MKNFFNHIFIISCIGILLFDLPGCKKSEDVKASDTKPEKALSDKQTFFPYDRVKVVHLFRDTVYTLSESFSRQAGEQLIIDEGTIIKVNAGGALVSITINSDGVILANGSRTNPIIFTSNTVQGNQNINWGGIIIQGKSIDNLVGTNGDPSDFSGSLNFVRIEFAGLVLTGVGSRTVIENVEVSYAHPQSSFEIDGGTFNVKNLVSYACGGPADFYISRGYSGKMQNILAYRHPFFGNSGNNPGNALTGIFIENNPGNSLAKPETYPIISNLTVLGPNAENGTAPAYNDTTLRNAAMITTGNAFFRIRNSLLLGFPKGGWYIDDSVTGKNVVNNKSEFTYSIVHCNDSMRAFYLNPESFPPFTSTDFKNFALRSEFGNQLYPAADHFMFSDPFHYDAGPNPFPVENSPVLTGANFDGTDFSDSFFDKVSYKGAVGKDDWLRSWASFIPLKTNYNFEH